MLNYKDLLDLWCIVAAERVSQNPQTSYKDAQLDSLLDKLDVEMTEARKAFRERV